MKQPSEVIASHSAAAQDSEHSLPQAGMPQTAMTQPWRHLEGQAVGGKFPLIQYLGGSEHSAVFLTERPQGQPRKAAIKLVTARDAASQLSRWAEAQKISHPHLARLFEMGRWRLGEEDLLYVVMEYADEELSQVLPTRSLTPRECQEMLPPVLEALACIHSHGLVHGHVKPANIMGVQEQLKISCDGLCTPGEASAPGSPSVYDAPEAATRGMSPGADVWSLGMTLSEVLTQKVPALEAGRREPVLPRSVPPALVNVVRNCLRLDPKQRWTVAEILARLAPSPALPVQQSTEHIAKPARVRKTHVAAAAIAMLLVFAVGWRLSHSGKSSAPAAAAPAHARVPADNLGATTSAAVIRRTELPPAPASASTPQTPLQGAVVREVLPKVPKSARDTIQGTIRVRVRVALDQSGSVARARFDSAGPSKYFARLAMQAAQEWKFAAPQPQGPNTAKEWLLRFEFRRNSTHVIPAPASH